MKKAQNPLFLSLARGLSLAAAFAFALVSVQAADVTKLSTGDIDSAAGWDGGALPGSSNVGYFDSSTVTSGTGASFNANGSGSNQTFAGLRFTSIAGKVTFTNVSTVTVGTSGIDMSVANADFTLDGGTLRFGGFSTFNIATGRTLTFQAGSTSANSQITVSGGGTVVALGAVSGANRLMFDVSNGILAGTGTFRPNNTNVGYGIRIRSGSYIAPGVPNSIGTLVIDSANTSENIVQMDSGAGFRMQLGTGSGTFLAPGTSDRILVANAVASDFEFLGNSIDLLGTGASGVYKLFDTSLNASTWTGLTLTGQQITAGLTITNLGSGLTGKLYMGDGGSFGDLGDIYLEVVPEPSTVALLGVGLAGLLWRSRRRV